MPEPSRSPSSDAPRRRGFVGMLLSIVAAILCVANSARSETRPPSVPAPGGPFPFAEYDALLKKYVDGQGRVDYPALKQNDAAAVERLYAFLAATGPDTTPDLYKGRDAALAYYLDAYNLLVWKNVIERIPKMKQVNESLYSFFRNPNFQVNGREQDLDDLEKKTIRPRFKDARVHFALNCASGGCPRLPREAFTPDRVQEQLAREAKLFCNERRNVDYDPAAKRVKLSMIFKWYKDDFGGSDESVLAFINKQRPADAQIPAGTKLDHVDYDWRMNDKKLPDRS